MFDNIKYIVIIVLFIFLGYFYYNNNILKGELKSANDLNSALEESVKSKDLEIQQLNNDAILITETKNKLDEVKNKQQKEIDSLNDKIKKQYL
jgi:predicted RND superfamily exporter protein